MGKIIQEKTSEPGKYNAWPTAMATKAPASKQQEQQQKLATLFLGQINPAGYKVIQRKQTQTFNHTPDPSPNNLKVSDITTNKLPYMARLNLFIETSV